MNSRKYNAPEFEIIKIKLSADILSSSQETTPPSESDIPPATIPETLPDDDL